MSARCVVVEHNDRITIRTDARRAEAILLALSGCTLQEVGDRFGVTRERIRQYLMDAGLSTKIRRRFAPSPSQDRLLTNFRGPSRRRAQRKDRIRKRMIRAVAWLRAYAAANGRAPNYTQLCDALGIRHIGTYPQSAGAALISHFGRRRSESSRVAIRRLHLVYRVAGLTVKRGAPSHRQAA